MTHIALFGASGKTGTEFLKIALANNYTVKALVRNQEKVQVKHEKLTIIQGDVLNEADVKKTIEGTEIVVSLFGQVKDSPEMLQTQGTKHIIQAMNAQGINKIISLSGGGLPFEKDEPKFIDKTIRTIMKTFFSKILNDAIAHAEVLKASDKDWIIVRGPRLTEEEEKGEYRVGWVGVNAGTSIGRKDLADFILTLVNSNEYLHQMPFVSY